MSMVEEYLEYRGDVQYRGGIMIHVGDIMSTMGVFSTLGDMIFCYLSASIVLNTPRYSWYPPTCIMISPMVYSNNER